MGDRRKGVFSEPIVPFDHIEHSHAQALESTRSVRVGRRIMNLKLDTP